MRDTSAALIIMAGATLAAIVASLRDSGWLTVATISVLALLLATPYLSRAQRRKVMPLALGLAVLATIGLAPRLESLL